MSCCKILLDLNVLIVQGMQLANNRVREGPYRCVGMLSHVIESKSEGVHVAPIACTIQLPTSVASMSKWTEECKESVRRVFYTPSIHCLIEQRIDIEGVN